MWVADHHAPTIASLVESVLKLYQQASFQVTEVCSDCEFKPVLCILQDGGWSFLTSLLALRNMFLKLSATIASSKNIFVPLIMGFLTTCSQEPFYATW